MNQSDVPARFPIPFANNAGASYIRSIPQAHQTPTGSDAPASLFDGFAVENFAPIGSGGIPPNGKDFNGILNQITAHNRWQAAGGPAIFNSTFATAIGGYPKGAVLASTVTTGLLWLSTVDGNTTDPDGGSPANWKGFGPALALTISAPNWRRVAADGFVEMGGVLNPFPRSTEGGFSMTFPFSGFPTACLGFDGVPINASSQTSGLTTIQEVSLSQTVASLFAQNHQSNLDDVSGGMRWRAWGY